MAFKRWNKSPSKRPPVKSWQPEEMKIPLQKESHHFFEIFAF